MPTPPSKTLSPAELAKLEHAFATDPGSEAYRPLADAYLSMSRFMEAMVVCKKGVKAHPKSAEPRLLLARVYAAQGKDRKVIEELTAALQSFPEDKAVLRNLGSAQLRAGEAEAGKANLLKAYAAGPTDAETLEAMKQFDVAVPAAPVAAPIAQQVQAAQARASAGAPPVLQPVAPQGIPPGYAAAQFAPASAHA